MRLMFIFIWLLLCSVTLGQTDVPTPEAMGQHEKPQAVYKRLYPKRTPAEKVEYRKMIDEVHKRQREYFEKFFRNGYDLPPHC